MSEIQLKSKFNPEFINAQSVIFGSLALDKLKLSVGGVSISKFELDMSRRPESWSSVSIDKKGLEGS